jgi:hypothetical protein
VIREAPVALAEWLDCRPTNDFVVAVEAPGLSEAVVTDCWGFAWRAACALAEEIAGDAVHRPPLDHHALLREGGSVWRHPDAKRGRLAVALLYRHEDCGEAASERDLVAITSSKGVPIKFVRQALHGEVNLDLIPHRDVRGHFPRTQDPALVRLGDLLTPPLLALGAVGMAEAS